MDDFRNTLTKMEDQFKMVLPPQISPEKFMRVVVTACQLNPKLLEATRASLFAGAMKAAQDGLLADGKEAALVPFKNKSGDLLVQYMPMVTGILKKVRNSGELASISAQVVYTKDEFDYWLDESGEHLKHKPSFEGDRGAVRLTYALARTKDNAVYIEVMTEDQVKAVKNVSRAKDSGPWAGAFADEMRKKTAIRRLSKRLPMSTDLEQVVQRDDDMYDLDPTEVQPEAPTKSSRLSQVVEASSPVPEAELTKAPGAPVSRKDSVVDIDEGSAQEPDESEIPL
jgi:recombination protein RecT